MTAPRRRIALLLGLTLLALAFRVSSFGDPVLHVGDEFYRFVGIAMHHGAVPYVDIWDRKPFGLFALYYGFAAISPAVITYQIAAWLSVSATAFVVTLIAERWASRRGAILAGCTYLAALSAFWGGGGEAAVFYNLLIAGGLWLVLNERPLAGMLCCGLAITLKQTALFEALFVGLVFLSSRPSLRAAAMAVGLGALPTLAIAPGYAVAGYWPQFWHAMVTSSLSRTPPDTTTMLVRGIETQLLLLPMLALAAWGWIAMGRERWIPGGWFAATLIGYLSVPTFYPHYVLPMLPPLCVAAAVILGRGGVGLVAAAFLIGQPLLLYNPFASHREAVEGAAAAARILSEDKAGRLLVFDGPTYFYTLPGMRYLSPLVFPTHLNHLDERDVSQFSTAAEMRRILAQRPTTVITLPVLRNEPVNRDSLELVRAYLAANCRLRHRAPMREMRGHQQFEIWFCVAARPEGVDPH